jgi:Fur family ferric uptake transcriptional regulator
VDNQDLKRAALVARHHFETGQAVLELESAKHHDHLIGVKCRRIIEFLDEDIEVKHEEISRNNGFQIEDHAFIIYGICSNDARQL